MNKTLAQLVFVFGILGQGSVEGAFINAWINELHYAQDGVDGGEFVEVIAPSSGVDLTKAVLTFYNGTTLAPYSPGGGSSQALSTFASGNSSFGFTVYTLVIGNGIRNGTDGLALSYDGTLLQFLSYKGTFTATSGIAAGASSTDIGVQEFDASATPVGYSIGLTGTGSQYSQFTWTTFSDDSPGSINMGQTLVPEPTQVAMGIFGAMISVGGIVRWKRKQSVVNR